MKKGDKVKCVACWDGEFAVGGIYEVLAGEGDRDNVCGGYVIGEGMILKTDDGRNVFAVFPVDAFGKWEIIK